MKTINMLSSADKIKGQGVGSAYLEQVQLIERSFPDEFTVYRNKLKMCDITHYHTVDFKHFLTLPFAKIKGCTVGYVHFLPETMEESLKLPPLAKKVFYAYLIHFYKSMDRLVTVNPCFIARLQKYGVSPEKVTYIPNFVSETRFYRLPDEQKSKLRSKYGVDKNRFVVLCAGQLQIRKGIFDFLKVAESLPDMQFVWAGGFSFGKITDGYDEIKKIVQNPPDNVKFLGIIPREDMNEIYNLADVMFLPSFEELFPMTILESMNCGVPILLRDLDLYEDILFDFYLKGHNLEDFKSLLERLSTDNTFYKNYSLKSHQGSVFYSREHVAAMWESFYNGLDFKAVKRHSPKKQTSKKLPLMR